jgi:hypothetical protein
MTRFEDELFPALPAEEPLPGEPVQLQRSAAGQASRKDEVPVFRASNAWLRLQRSSSLQLLLALLVTLVALVGGYAPLILVASLVLVALALVQLVPPLWRQLSGRLDDGPTALALAVLALVIAAVSIPLSLGWLEPFLNLFRSRNWEAVGAIGEGVVGAFGQILVAFVALLIAW